MKRKKYDRPSGPQVTVFYLSHCPYHSGNETRNETQFLFFYLFSCPYYSGKETLFLLRHFVWWWIANDARLCVGAVNIGKNGDIWLAITDLTLTGIPELGGHVTLGLKTNLRPRVSQIERFGFQKVKQWPAASDLWNVTCVLDPPGTVPKNKKTNLHNPYSARALREIIIWLAPWAGKMNQIARYDQSSFFMCLDNDFVAIKILHSSHGNNYSTKNYSYRYLCWNESATQPMWEEIPSCYLHLVLLQS